MGLCNVGDGVDWWMGFVVVTTVARVVEGTVQETKSAQVLTGGTFGRKFPSLCR